MPAHQPMTIMFAIPGQRKNAGFSLSLWTGKALIGVRGSGGGSGLTQGVGARGRRFILSYFTIVSAVFTSFGAIFLIPMKPLGPEC